MKMPPSRHTGRKRERHSERQRDAGERGRKVRDSGNKKAKIFEVENSSKR